MVKKEKPDKGQSEQSSESPESGQTENKEREPVVGYVFSSGLPELLQQLNISLIVTTYQAQRILAFSSFGSKMSMLMRIFPRPTGFAIRGGEMAMVSKNQIWLFDTLTQVRDEEGNALPYDLTFTPRCSFVTGDVAGHEINWVRNRLVFLNTRFSCVATVSNRWSFEPVWKPPFISRLAADDRCHLNGMAVENGELRFVTALGESDAPSGWRENKRDGGIVIDVRSGQVVARNMSMPHSPRLYAGRLWVLESGRGELQVLDPVSGVREVVQRFPGYLRGLAFYDRYAFVGLCLIREKKEFGGLPIEEKGIELQSGIHVVDITTGQVVAFLTFTKGIEELFDIQILPGVTRPHIIGFEEDTIDGLYSLPPNMLS